MERPRVERPRGTARVEHPPVERRRTLPQLSGTIGDLSRPRSLGFNPLLLLLLLLPLLPSFPALPRVRARVRGLPARGPASLLAFPPPTPLLFTPFTPLRSASPLRLCVRGESELYAAKQALYTSGTREDRVLIFKLLLALVVCSFFKNIVHL